MAMTLDKALEIFGLQSGASAEEVTRTYRKLAWKHHPDRNSGTTAEMQALVEAYEFLQKFSAGEINANGSAFNAFASNQFRSNPFGSNPFASTGGFNTRTKSTFRNAGAHQGTFAQNKGNTFIDFSMDDIAENKTLDFINRSITNKLGGRTLFLRYSYTHNRDWKIQEKINEKIRRKIKSYNEILNINFDKISENNEIIIDIFNFYDLINMNLKNYYGKEIREEFGDLYFKLVKKIKNFIDSVKNIDSTKTSIAEMIKKMTLASRLSVSFDRHVNGISKNEIHEILSEKIILKIKSYAKRLRDNRSIPDSELDKITHDIDAMATINKSVLRNIQKDLDKLKLDFKKYSGKKQNPEQIIESRNIRQFKATLDFLTGGYEKRKVDAAMAAMTQASIEYNDNIASGDIPSEDIKKTLKETREMVIELALKCQNLLDEQEDLSKSTIAKLITGIMNVFKATGDSAMYLQGEKMLAEARLVDPPDKHILRKVGDYLLKFIITLAQFILNTTVKIRAFFANTEINDEVQGYRDKVLRRKPR